MRAFELACPVCGSRLASEGHTPCDSCPLNRGCGLLCCPECGYSTVDPHRSPAARGLKRILKRRRGLGAARHRPGRRRAPAGDLPAGELPPIRSGGRPAATAVSLGEVPPGTEARVCAFANGMSVRWREALTAYGLCPGRRLRVRRTSPVTVVQVDQLELALESEMAEMIQVDGLECPRPEAD